MSGLHGLGRQIATSTVTRMLDATLFAGIVQGITIVVVTAIP